MKLEEKVFVFDTDLNLEKADITIVINDAEEGIAPKYIFKDLEIDEDTIQGYSLLQFYKLVKNSLVDNEGNVLNFKVKGQKLDLVNVRDPLISNKDLSVDLEYVEDVSALLGVTDIPGTFTKLSIADKAALINKSEELTAKELKKKEDADKAALEAEEEARLQVLADQVKEELRLSKEAEKEHEQKVEANKIPEGDNIITPKEYKLLIRKYQRMGFKEYKKDHFSFFHGEDVPDGELPFILANRGEYYEELDGSVVADDEKGVEYEFSDEKVDKIATLQEGNFSIEEL